MQTILHNPAQLLNLIQRVSGLAALALLVIQIVIAKKFPRLHRFNAFLLFGLILIHIFSYVFFVKIIKGVFDPFYPFTDLCILCKNVIYPEYFVNLGRIAFWLFTFSFLAIILKSYNSWWRKYWFKFHSLGIVALILAILHYFLLK